jgi:hypothetical protein
MPAAANGNLQSLVSGEPQRGEDVGRTGATGDEGGPSADRAVPDRADFFVAFISRAMQRTRKTLSELLNGGLVQAGIWQCYPLWRSDRAPEILIPVRRPSQQCDAAKIAVRYT